ncbi:M55 family metallopeptidase [Acidobacteriota bacterium]
MTKRKAATLLVALIGFVCLISCTSDKVTEAKSPRVLLNPALNADGVIKLLLYYDMEGISGQKSIQSIDFGNEEYFEAREWLTNDVNAVIDGLFAGGADSVEVVDAHGSFNPEPDILLDKMDPRAQMLYKDKPFRPYVDLVEEGVYDAIVLVCMHSKTGGGGFASHTVNFGMDWILNDMSINESEIFAYSWGRAKVPLIFVSGDDKLGEQLSWMDWLEYVVVKNAKGADDAVLRPFVDVHEEMRAGAQRAVQNISQSKAIELTVPIKVQLRAVPPADLSLFASVPCIEYSDQTVTFEAVDFMEAYDGIRGLMSAAQTGYWQLLLGSLFRDEAGRKVFESFKKELFSLWADVESGRWKPPSPPPKQAVSGKKYFGST